jgi:hypothetical protein
VGINSKMYPQAYPSQFDPEDSSDTDAPYKFPAASKIMPPKLESFDSEFPQLPDVQLKVKSCFSWPAA